jgi:hypothetical protein
LFRNLPPPLRPSAPHQNSSGAESDTWQRRGSLSDFSDYESSDEETHNANVAAAGPSKRKARRSYVNVSDDPDDGDDEVPKGTEEGKAQGKALENPFSDPFA